MRTLYAAYGSNLHPVRLRERTPSLSLSGTATLPDRSIRFHKRSNDGSGKCNIVEGDGEIHLAIYEIATGDLPDLDRAEGLGHGYERRKIEVPGFGDCFVYIAAASHIEDSLQPYTWYKELVLVGARHHGFPPPYLARISAVEAIEDPNRRRHDTHMRLVHRARNGT